MKKKFLLLSLLFGLNASVGADDHEDSREAFRVCADGNYLPMSNRELAGYENRIAALLAEELNLPVEYYWFPQRLGFIRNTLRKKNPDTGQYHCDVVMGVPHRYELTITTDAYMRSTYALAYVKGKGLDDIKTQADFLAMSAERKAELKIGAHERNPGVQLLAENNMFLQLVPYVAQGGDPNVAPAQLERDDLLAGNIDMAILWGPLAAQLRNESKDADIGIVPLESTPSIRFDFPFALGVRHPDKQWRDQLDEALVKNKDEINEILMEYGIPLVDEDGKPLQ